MSFACSLIGTALLRNATLVGIAGPRFVSVLTLYAVSVAACVLLFGLTNWTQLVHPMRWCGIVWSWLGLPVTVLARLAGEGHRVLVGLEFVIVAIGITISERLVSGGIKAPSKRGERVPRLRVDLADATRVVAGLGVALAILACYSWHVVSSQRKPRQSLSIPQRPTRPTIGSRKRTKARDKQKQLRPIMGLPRARVIYNKKGIPIGLLPPSQTPPERKPGSPTERQVPAASSRPEGTRGRGAECVPPE